MSEQSSSLKLSFNGGCFRESYTINRRTKGVKDNEGRYLTDDVVTKIIVLGSAPQPVNDKSLIWLPDGLQDKQIFTIYTAPLTDKETYIFLDDRIEKVNGQKFRIFDISERTTHARIRCELLHKA